MSPLKKDVLARIARSLPGLDIEPGAVGDALAWSLLFQHWPELVPGPPLDQVTAFYNRYFRFKRFATLKQKQDGYDAGLEQQASQLLEYSELDLDLELLGRLDAEAAKVAHPLPARGD
ncbi:MAG TPA: hypothetical protein VGH28_05995 [Polyangiaceae bacterium]|jgi:hypothetical protein